MDIAPAINVPTLTTFADLLGAFREEAEAAHDAYTSGRQRGPMSQFPKLDRELGGHLPPGYHGLLANTGAGKSALGLQIAGTCGAPALYVSAEQSALEQFRRTISRTTGVYLNRLRTGEIAPEMAMQYARQTIEAVPYLAIADCTTAPATPQWIYNQAVRVKGDHPYLFLVIDSIHSWTLGLFPEASEYDRLSQGVDTVRSLALKLNCPVLGIAEQNRGAIKGGGGVNSGAGNRILEYAAESVWTLEPVDKEAKPDAMGEIPMKLRIVKNRFGGAGKGINMLFKGAEMRFREAE